MNKRGMGFWDVLAWIILVGILIWIILKVTGIINTSPLLEYAPYFGIVYLVGWAMHKLDTATSDIKDVKSFNNETIKQINNIKEKCIRNHPKSK